MNFKEDAMILLLPVVCESIHSLKILNLLMRTNKRLSTEANNFHTISTVVKNMSAMNQKTICKLFILRKGDFKIPFIYNKLLYSSRVFHRTNIFSPYGAFKRSIILHGSVSGISEQFHRRMIRSNAMKLACARLRGEKHQELEARRNRIKQIRQDLGIVECGEHWVTDAEQNYLDSSFIGRLNSAYRDHKLMAHYMAGILYLTENTFRTVALKDLRHPSTLTEDEKYYILCKNIVYEHFLFNYTNYLTLLYQNLVDTVGIQYLFDLPSVWPWKHFSNRFFVVDQENISEENKLRFRMDHDVLYE